MRAAPIGAWFAEDPQLVIDQARISAEVTHAHPDGKTGAIAVALAAAWMVSEYESNRSANYGVIEFVLAHLPQTETYWRLKKALTVPLQMSPLTAALILGNGSQVVSSDTVPFALWMTCRHLADFPEALWQAARCHGDIDTNCAIVGSLLSLGLGSEKIPEEWLLAREPLTSRLPR